MKPQITPQITGWRRASHNFPPLNLPLNPWSKMKPIARKNVSIFISGKTSYISCKSKCPPIPRKVFIEGMRTDTSSTRKINHVKNTKYWVMSHEMSMPTLPVELKNDSTKLTLLPNRWTMRRSPCTKPHRTKFHDAPCHNPPNNIVIINAKIIRLCPFLEPPRGM